MKMTTVYTQSKNCWAIDCDCAQAGVDASKFIRACRTHLNRDTFPTALWYHDRGSDGSPHQRVECYGPNAKRDARDAAIILSGLVIGNLEIPGRSEPGNPRTKEPQRGEAMAV